ncbi:hypothetical protein [Paremcibacter congregatus]|uniref:Uncharacterized protein n=1 Tax=Paremcibacter congregatus TaxID=2043170 RepID=A0A2G4YVM2_9PROT|nr:hypothetical protein [Paremcibacter congregatus]PHZ86377.1 hypothetical protein CRD36_02115 [Paremcibacter congregatus]QDE27978.1 hypothetical protein FIV45_12195 [Paremcibacter congregatus]
MSDTSKPDYIAYNVTEANDEKSIWNAVGAAWTHSDNKGINIVLYAVPVTGKITLRTPKSDEDK